MGWILLWTVYSLHAHMGTPQDCKLFNGISQKRFAFRFTKAISETKLTVLMRGFDTFLSQ